jgi:transposase
VKIMPPSSVKAYLRRGKTDAADAAAIREAVMRPHMRSVPVKTFNRLAGYAYVNGAERLRHDAAMLDVWFHTLGARIS